MARMHRLCMQPCWWGRSGEVHLCTCTCKAVRRVLHSTGKAPLLCPSLTVTLRLNCPTDAWWALGDGRLWLCSTPAILMPNLGSAQAGVLPLPPLWAALSLPGPVFLEVVESPAATIPEVYVTSHLFNSSLPQELLRDQKQVLAVSHPKKRFWLCPPSPQLLLSPTMHSQCLPCEDLLRVSQISRCPSLLVGNILPHCKLIFSSVPVYILCVSIVVYYL